MKKCICTKTYFKSVKSRLCALEDNYGRARDVAVWGRQSVNLCRLLTTKPVLYNDKYGNDSKQLRIWQWQPLTLGKSFDSCYIYTYNWKRLKHYVPTTINVLYYSTAAFATVSSLRTMAYLTNQSSFTQAKLRLLLMIPYCRFKARWDGDGGRLHLDAESLWPRAQVWPPFC